LCRFAPECLADFLCHALLQQYGMHVFSENQLEQVNDLLLPLEAS
jgi:hypothetical protein